VTTVAEHFASRLISLPQRGLILLVRGYRLLLSPWLGSSCRFEPTCSAYALEALQRHGAAAGTYMTGARLLRCHPWCAGGFDAVPHQPPALFRRFITEAVPSTPMSDKTP
jgi:putative membrane protein insertion efficiency factor